MLKFTICSRLGAPASLVWYPHRCQHYMMPIFITKRLLRTDGKQVVDYLEVFFLKHQHPPKLDMKGHTFTPGTWGKLVQLIGRFWHRDNFYDRLLDDIRSVKCRCIKWVIQNMFLKTYLGIADTRLFHIGTFQYFPFSQFRFFSTQLRQYKSQNLLISLCVNLFEKLSHKNIFLTSAEQITYYIICTDCIFTNFSLF